MSAGGTATVERRAVGVLYAELRNFTRLSEVLDPARVMELANEFFTLAGRHLGAGSGRVVAVHNDSILGIFTAAADALPRCSAAGPPGQQQFVAFGDCVSIAERIVHRARPARSCCRRTSLRR